MRVKAKELQGALKAAGLFVSLDLAKSGQSCVHLEAADKAIRIVATDGHTLWCCEVAAEEIVDDRAPVDQPAWNIRGEDVENIVRRLKGATDADVNLSERSINGQTYVQGSDYFPPYQVAVPVFHDEKSDAKPEFAACYVGRACEAFQHYSAGHAPELSKTGTKYEKRIEREHREAYKSPIISWRTFGEYDPMFVFSPKFPRAFAVVMPVRPAGYSVREFVEQVRSGKGRKAA